MICALRPTFMKSTPGIQFLERDSLYSLKNFEWTDFKTNKYEQRLFCTFSDTQTMTYCCYLLEHWQLCYNDYILQQARPNRFTNEHYFLLFIEKWQLTLVKTAVFWKILGILVELLDACMTECFTLKNKAEIQLSLVILTCGGPSSGRLLHSFRNVAATSLILSRVSWMSWRLLVLIVA